MRQGCLKHVADPTPPVLRTCCGSLLTGRGHSGGVAPHPAYSGYAISTHHLLSTSGSRSTQN